MKRKGLLLTGILASLGAFALVLGTAKSIRLMISVMRVGAFQMVILILVI